MAKFRKKPIVIEAVQFTEEMLLDEKLLPSGISVVGKYWHPGKSKIYSYRAIVKTLEGDMEVKIGDWIITGVEGEVYSCKPSIFFATYDLVEEL